MEYKLAYEALQLQYMCIYICMHIILYIYLVGGLEHEFYFSIYWKYMLGHHLVMVAAPLRIPGS